MGNEGSQLSGLEIANEIIEVTNSWTLKNASLQGSTRPLSLFISQEETILQLEQAAKKLKLYRHPGIVKYVDTWKQSGSLYLATERVVPLAQVLPTLSSLQACLGLRSILSALVFLHDRAQVSHNNVCCASIYVASDGTWKLGNFEFLCNQQELSTAFLRERKPRRYEPAIAPDEDKGIAVPSSVDVFAFGRLVQEVLKHKKVPGEFADAANNFLSIATTQLQQTKPEARGNLAPLLEHSYFSHPVVAVVEFLSALTLKSADEKEQFFRSLWIQLATLPEVMVATQLADLLLSRLVLLESSAQQHLLPWLLAVRQDDLDSGSIQSGECSPIFSKAVFEQHIAPKLSRIFQVRDSQVRSVLLRHFSKYCHTFNKHQLQQEILPELLVGIKDESDALVADTLRALAELVPLLGAAAVIGGKRGRLFTDGRPKIRQPKTGLKIISNKIMSPSRSQEPSNVDAHPVDCISVSGSPPGELPERPSPDGGEAWSDWDDQQDETDQEIPAPPVVQEEKLQLKPVVRAVINDLDALDIKVAKITALPLTKEVDFFQDMEPVISSAKTLLLAEEEEEEEEEREEEPTTSEVLTDKFKVTEDVGEEAGWGEDEFLDWGSSQDEENKLVASS